VGLLKGLLIKELQGAVQLPISAQMTLFPAVKWLSSLKRPLGIRPIPHVYDGLPTLLRQTLSAGSLSVLQMTE
jgi:hypothetical protein